MIKSELKNMTNSELTMLVKELSHEYEVKKVMIINSMDRLDQIEVEVKKINDVLKSRNL
jgi:hypothetical protein